MSHNLGADELRIRGSLRRLIDGPDVEPELPAEPPADDRPRRYEPARKRDWLDDILDANITPAPTSERPASGPVDLPAPVVKKPAKPQAKTPKKPHRQRPTYRAEQHQDMPRLSLLDAWDHAPRRLKWLAYHATAAAAGWWLGWVDWATDTAAWYAAGHWITPSALVLYGLGVVLLAIYRRTRTVAWPIAWAAAIPVSSVVAGVLLYGTGYHP